MGFADAYLNKQHYKRKSIAGAPPQGLLRYIIIIPAYCEPDIILTLESIRYQNQFQEAAEAIVLFNYPENDSKSKKDENEHQYQEVKSWCNKHAKDKILFHPLLVRDLPYKIAGAGMARKIAMDMAVERFNLLDQPDGIILSVDADTVLPANYLQSVEERLKNSPGTNAFIFNFEHETSGTEFAPAIYRAAILYELHMRYYRLMLDKSGFPYPYFTIGSCFGVKAGLYSKIGGMNRRKAGEDFYFLQKIFPFGNVAFLNKVIISLSSRPSWRVPFGTGPAIRKIVGANMDFHTYNPKAFTALKEFFEMIPQWHNLNLGTCIEQMGKLHDSLQQFLRYTGFENKLNEIKSNSSSIESFTKRFFAWFDAFLIIKYLNFSKEPYFPETGITHALKEGLGIHGHGDEIELLRKLRQIDQCR